MAAISAADVKKLRDVTGAGMMDCKKALTEAEGDFAKAEKILKEMGLAAVAKRQDRATENGRVFVKIADGKVVLLSLSCETDFVAKNADFAKLGDDMCDAIIKNGWTEPNEELKSMVDGLIAIIKENMNLVKFTVIELGANQSAAGYIHGEGNVAVAVVLSSDNTAAFENAEVQDLSHNLALHAAAFKPVYLNAESVDKAYEDEQLEIFQKQVDTDPKMAAKPEKVKEGIVRGKLSKLYKEICFTEQAYVKDDDLTVGKYVAATAKELGIDIKIVSFVLFEKGEGIQKREENFAEEIAKLTNK